MPKKRKRDKIASDARRRVIAEKWVSYNFVKPQPQAEAIVPSKDSGAMANQHRNAGTTIQTHSGLVDTAHLKKDLVKIFIYTVLALSFQVVLYYLHRG